MSASGSPPLVSSPLAEIHAGLGAKLAAFGGWEMPLEYAGVLPEHKAVRTAAGIFDVSHLGTFVVEGPGAAAWLNSRLSNDLDRISPGQAQYTLLLDAGGGVVDDMIVYLFGPDRVMVIPNAANSDEVLRRLRSGAGDGLVWTDRHVADAIIAVQGPVSGQVLSGAGLPVGMGYMSFVLADWEGGPLTVCRTGYTGELGYEVVVGADRAGLVWDRLMKAGLDLGLVPCGLGARDTLRTEMGYPLHGQDISLEISPVEARLNWAIGWKKAAFDGAEVVRRQRQEGVERTLLGVKAVGRGIPRPGMTVVSGSGEPIGEITSGTYSPTLKTGIGLALLPAGTTPGTQVLVDIRGRREAFEVVKPPFVPSQVT